mgnify:CR=1 FL=1
MQITKIITKFVTETRKGGNDMLGILSTIMALYGVGMAGGATAYAVGSSIKSCGASESKAEDRENLPILHEKSPDGISSVDYAYYDKKTRKYVARIYCYLDGNKNWTEADSFEKLRKEIDNIYDINNSAHYYSTH